MIDPFLSCLACDITFSPCIFRKIRAKNVISQTRQDKKGAIKYVSSGASWEPVLQQARRAGAFTARPAGARQNEEDELIQNL